MPEGAVSPLAGALDTALCLLAVDHELKQCADLRSMNQMGSKNRLGVILSNHQMLAERLLGE